MGFLGADSDAVEAAAFRKLRQSETTKRPIDGDVSLEALETKTGRPLKPHKRGPERKLTTEN